MADQVFFHPIEITFDTTLEDIIKATTSDDCPATPQPVTTASQPATTASNPDPSSFPHIDIPSMDDIIRATILDYSPDSSQHVTTTSQSDVHKIQNDTSQSSTTDSQPDSDNSQPDIDNSQPDINTSQLDINTSQPDIDNSQPDINNSQPDINNSQPDIDNSQPDDIPSSDLVIINYIIPETSTASREQQLLQRLDSLRPFHPRQINDLTSFYKNQSAKMETDRYCALRQNSSQPHHIQENIKQLYTIMHHHIMDQTDNRIQILEKNIPQQPSTTTQNTTYSKGPRPKLSQKAIQLMEAWYNNHLHHPYPSSDVIQDLATRGGIKEEQVKKWFSNKRNRSKKSSGISKKKMSSVNRC